MANEGDMRETSDGNFADRELICFTGTGGTGKTTAMRAFLEPRPGWLHKPSVVREYYALRGVASEAEYLRPDWGSPEDRFEFQIGLLEYFIRTTADFLRDNPGRPVIMDRSAFCHVAYCVYANPGAGIGQLNRALSYAEAFAAKFRPTCVYFPYPAPWSGTAAAEDGFRRTDCGKDFAVSSMMLAVLTRHYPRFRTAPVLPPERRAELIAAYHAEEMREREDQT